MLLYREPTSSEINNVDSLIERLKEAFYLWPWYHSDPYSLLRFAYYEGCNEPIMAEAAPYAVGISLVNKHSFDWVMIKVADSWHYGVVHPILSKPIDLLMLENGEWYRPEPDDEPPLLGETTLLSHEVIVLAMKWKQLKGSDAPIPEGSLTELEQKVNRASILG